MAGDRNAEEAVPHAARLNAVGRTAVGVAPFLEYAAVRTRYFDDGLLEARAAGCRQVVILAPAWTRTRSGCRGRLGPGCTSSTSPRCWLLRRPRPLWPAVTGLPGAGARDEPTGWLVTAVSGAHGT